MVIGRLRSEFISIGSVAVLVGKIKPILLPLDSLRLEGVDKGDLVGRVPQVWFDGQIENEEMEMSNPIDLGQVYRISLIEEEK